MAALDLGGAQLPDHLRDRLEALETRLFGAGEQAGPSYELPVAARLRDIDARCSALETAESRSAAAMRKRLHLADSSAMASSFVPVDTKLEMIGAAEEDLKRTAGLLEEVERLQTHINAPFLRDLPANTDKLVQAEEQQAADLAAATEIHARVNSLVQANEAVVGLLSEKLVAWDQLLRHKEGQKR